jgi:hypothetical protein
MRIPSVQLSSSVSLATLVSLLVAGKGVASATIAAFLVATLDATLGWPSTRPS